MIPKAITIQNGGLPDEPGVYFYYDAKGKLLYIGKATSLKTRVGSYFSKAHDARIERLVSEIARIDYLIVPTVIEALVLEANQVRAHQPPYNIDLKDDKSFVYLAITNDAYPRPLLVRGLELGRMGIDPFVLKAPKPYLNLFGPFMSAKSLKTVLDLLRRSIPWSDCWPGQKRPCFNAQIGKCPGVCMGTIRVREYKKIIRELELFFSGKKKEVVRRMKREMEAASKVQDFERATVLRNRLFALEHIRDVALLTREETAPYLVREEEGYIDLNGRIEAYDISNISGTSAVASMVVFEGGKPAKDKYRKFKIKTVKGSNDVAMMEEVLRRRLKHAFPPAGGGTKGGGRLPHGWELPQVMVIDGGLPQVHRVQDVLDEYVSSRPLRRCSGQARRRDLRRKSKDVSAELDMTKKPAIVGLAKGFDRKQDVLVYDKNNIELSRIVSAGKDLFQKARDEAHRFAVRYHRTLRAKRFLKK